MESELITRIDVSQRNISLLELFNSSSPGAAYMRRRTGSTLVQVMACRLFGAKPLPEPMMAYCQLDSLEQTSVTIQSKYKLFI